MNRLEFPIVPVDPAKYHNPWHPDDPVVFVQSRRYWKLDYPWDEVSAETRKLLESSRLSMKCPYCSTTSPAGVWCYKCGRMIRPNHWFRGSSAEVAPGKRRRGRPSKKDIEDAVRTCSRCGVKSHAKG